MHALRLAAVLTLAVPTLALEGANGASVNLCTRLSATAAGPSPHNALVYAPKRGQVRYRGGQAE